MKKKLMLFCAFFMWCMTTQAQISNFQMTGSSTLSEVLPTAGDLEIVRTYTFTSAYSGTFTIQRSGTAFLFSRPAAWGGAMSSDSITKVLPTKTFTLSGTGPKTIQDTIRILESQDTIALALDITDVNAASTITLYDSVRYMPGNPLSYIMNVRLPYFTRDPDAGFCIAGSFCDSLTSFDFDWLNYATEYGQTYTVTMTGVVHTEGGSTRPINQTVDATHYWTNPAFATPYTWQFVQDTIDHYFSIPLQQADSLLDFTVTIDVGRNGNIEETRSYEFQIPRTCNTWEFGLEPSFFTQLAVNQNAVLKQGYNEEGNIDTLAVDTFASPDGMFAYEGKFYTGTPGGPGHVTRDSAWCTVVALTRSGSYDVRTTWNRNTGYNPWAQDVFCSPDGLREVARMIPGYRHDSIHYIQVGQVGFNGNDEINHLNVFYDTVHINTMYPDSVGSLDTMCIDSATFMFPGTTPGPQNTVSVDMNFLIACAQNVGVQFYMSWYTVDTFGVTHQHDTLIVIDSLYSTNPWKASATYDYTFFVPYGPADTLVYGAAGMLLGGNGYVFHQEEKTSGTIQVNEHLFLGLEPPRITQEEQFFGIKLYPNPASDQLTLDIPVAGEYHVCIYNAMGQQLCRGTSLTEGQTQMNVSDLASGMYFVQIRSVDTGYTTTKQLRIK